MNERFNFRIAIKQADGTYKRYKVISLGRDARGLYARCAIPHKGNEFYLHDIIIDGNNAILEQCTELKDKNGEWIYEGDVVRTKEYGRHVGNVNVWDYDTFTIKFDECRFYVENDSRRFCLSDRSKVEIIGNIHDKEGK